MDVDKWTFLEVIARLGFVAKGLVYFMVGLLALQTAIGLGGESASTQHALQELIYQPLGAVLLIGCAIGLLAHGLWKVLQSVIDPEERTANKKIIFLRMIDFFIGLLYFSFAYMAWQIFQGFQTQSSGQSTEIWVGKILEFEYGNWLVLFLGLLIFITGLYQFYTAYTANFDYSFNIKEMTSTEQKLLRKMGQIGISAWGVVYGMVAFLFYQSAIHFNAQKAGGIDKALNALHNQPFGIWILGITAVGLLIYGAYLLTLSYYHKIYSQ
jgi:hypothetical protein